MAGQSQKHLYEQKLVTKHHFGNAHQRALLYMLSKGSASSRKKWSRKLVVLTNIGLFLFESMKDFSPFYFPVMNADLNFDSSLSAKVPPPPKDLASSRKFGNEFPLLKISLLNMEPVLMLFSSFKDRHAWVTSISRM